MLDRFKTQFSGRQLRARRGVQIVRHHARPDLPRRRLVVVPSIKDIVERAEDDNGAIHDDAPVHCLGFGVDDTGEEAEDEDRHQVTHSADVDEHAPAAEGPARLRDRLALQAPHDHVADGDHVRGQETGGVEGEDGVQRRSGADVDKRK